jgi:hypothetical protein
MDTVINLSQIAAFDEITFMDMKQHCGDRVKICIELSVWQRFRNVPTNGDRNKEFCGRVENNRLIPVIGLYGKYEMLFVS